MILLVDNYDSFTFNLAQLIQVCAPEEALRVVRNDEVDAALIESWQPSSLILSPGPYTPAESGISNELIRRVRGRIPILGVCLGHQCLAHVHGIAVTPNFRVMHGRTSWIHHDGKTIYAGLENPFQAMRYHSLIVERSALPADVEITAWTDCGEVMGLRAQRGGILEEGVQFHPESFLTPAGPRLIENFLRARGHGEKRPSGKPS